MNSDDNTTPVLTTAHGDPVTLSRSSFLIKSIRKFLSILDSCEEFVELENDGSKTLRYDWVEKLDANEITPISSKHQPSSNLVNTNDNGVIVGNQDKNNLDQQQKSGFTHTYTSKELALQTILWVSVDEEEDDKNNNKKTKKNSHEFIPYRVLGNLGITGKALVIECLSDSLLFRCNNLLQSLAGKYLRHVGNTYEEIPSTTSEDSNEQYPSRVSNEYNSNEQYDEVYENVDEDEDDYVDDEGIQNTIENSFKNMI